MDPSEGDARIRHYARQGLKYKTYQRWSKERILFIIQESYHGQSFNDIDPNLISAASQYFGGFYKAVEAAGLSLPQDKWSKRSITERIQEYYISGYRLEINGFGDKRFDDNAKRDFGT